MSGSGNSSGFTAEFSDDAPRQSANTYTVNADIIAALGVELAYGREFRDEEVRRADDQTLSTMANKAIITRELAEADPDRVVIFDAPPLLATTEAAVLARHMGQVVVVVEANKTPQDAVSRSVEQLEGCANVSLILNKTSQRESGAYGYGYGYAQNYRRKAEASAEVDQDEEVEVEHDRSLETRK
jgi:nitrate reductase NapAB chaperone NapD